MLGLEQYIDLVFTMLESLLLFIFLSAILNSNSNVSKELIITSIILYALIVFRLNHILPFSGIRIIYFLLLSIAFNFFLYRKKIFIKIILPVFFFACVLISELMSLTIIEITTNFKIQELLLNELWFTTLHFGISKIILIIFLLVIVYYVKRSFLLRYSKHSYAIVASSIVSVLVLSMLSEIGIKTSYFDISPYYLVLCILGILFVNFLVPYLVYVLTNY